MDYKGGKKKLKKLEKAAIPSGPKSPHIIRTPKFTTANTSAQPPENLQAQSEEEITDQQPGAYTTENVEYGTIQNEDNTENNNTSTTESIALPPPALHHHSPRRAKTSSDVGEASQQQQQQQRSRQMNDRSPLLTPRGKTRTQDQNDSKSPVLDQMSKAASEREFLNWLDSELLKIEQFYLEKESEAIDKFLVLQDQLYKLQTHRRASKRKAVTTINRAAKSTKLMMMKKVGLPSLPVMINTWLTPKSKRDAVDELRDIEEEDHNTSSADYTKQAGAKVTYNDAKRQIKAALSEYYRSLELLKGYRALNQTGFRKMIKKFDKTTNRAESNAYMEKVHDSEFSKSDTLDNLVSKTEDLYAKYFENGNHKQAVEKLRSKFFASSHYAEMFTSGLFLGLSVPLFIQALYMGLKHLTEGTHPDTTYLFQVWGGFFIVNLMLILFTLNLWVWTKYKVNYPFIFEFDQRHFMDYRQYGELPAFLMFLMSLFAWLTFNDFFPDTYPGKYFAPLYLGIAVLLWVLPLPILHYRSRRWLLIACWRLLLSGLYPVEFRDFFMGDIFTSMTYSISNASFFFCLYANHWGKGPPVSSKLTKCSSSESRLLGFLNCLPGIWRFLQCLRRYGDTADSFPHLANAGKYTFQILYYVFLSIIRIDKTNSTAFRALFITFASVNAVYSSFWDVFMDFSLGQPESKHGYLRDELAFPSKLPYYAIIIIDPILRFNWVLYVAFSKQVQQSAKISFFVALIEIIRRFLWAFFRVENEHSTNVARFRASRDLTLPYPPAIQSRSESKELERDSAESTALSRRSIINRRAATTAYDVLGRRGDEESGEEGLRDRRGTATSSQEQPQKLQRRGTIASIATPVIRALGSAHARDFERRKIPAYHGEEEDVDDDDESSDNNNGGHNNHHTHQR